MIHRLTARAGLNPTGMRLRNLSHHTDIASKLRDHLLLLAGVHLWPCSSQRFPFNEFHGKMCERVNIIVVVVDLYRNDSRDRDGSVCTNEFHGLGFPQDMNAPTGFAYERLADASNIIVRVVHT